MRYLKSFSFLSKADEEDFFLALKRTCYQTAYPLAIFPEKGLKKLEFEPVTILCGCNGSGKTTALNIIAESIGAKRVSPYNKSAFFAEYVAGCKPEFDPGALADCEGGFNKEIITSDDVFDFIFNIRSLNDGIDRYKERRAVYGMAQGARARCKAGEAEQHGRLRKACAAEQAAAHDAVPVCAHEPCRQRESPLQRRKCAAILYR